MDEHSPLVCVCIPTFNSEKTLRETLTSILNQSHKNLIVNVVDNASTDSTISIARDFSDSRIRIHQNKSNIGAEANFTRCIDLMTGDYSAIFHADDRYTPQMVGRQVKFLEKNPAVGAVFTNAALINESGVQVGTHGISNSAKSINDTYDFATLFKLILRYGNFLICPSALVRTGIYRGEIKTWRGSKYGTSADLDVWLRIAMNHLVGVLPDRLIQYRLSSIQGSSVQRARVNRADMFFVLDDYFAERRIRESITPQDFRNYVRLQRTDRVVRAVNLYLSRQLGEARELLQGTFTSDAVFAAASGSKGLLTISAALLIRLFIWLGDPAFGRSLVESARRAINK